MKQHITPKQFKEMSQEKTIELFGFIKRKDFYNYHHKKITIGKMIEILQDKNIRALSEILIDYHRYLDDYKDAEFSFNYSYNGFLCDALWDEIKFL